MAEGTETVIDPAAAAPAPAAPPAAPGAAAPIADAAAAPAAAAPAAPAAAAPAAAAAPEVYTDFTAPEGTTLDKSITDPFKEVAKELKLSQADAQKVIDKLAPIVAKGEGGRVKALADNAAAAWLKQSQTDAEIGGEKLPENTAIAMKTFDAFGTPALRKVLNETGLGNHPELLRWAYRIGQHLGPDNKFVTGQTATIGPRAAEDVLWPDRKTA